MRSGSRISATPAARRALAALRAATGGQVMLVQSGGCCAGSVPMCFPEGEFVVGDDDLRLGTVDGTPFYIDRALDIAWGGGRFVLDIADGAPDGFSLGAGDSLHHFVTCGGAACDVAS